MICTGCSNKHGTERDDRYSTQNETGQNGRERKKLERNDPDEGPRSRTERKDKKKVGTCLAECLPFKNDIQKHSEFSPRL